MAISEEPKFDSLTWEWHVLSTKHGSPLLAMRNNNIVVVPRVSTAMFCWLVQGDIILGNSTPHLDSQPLYHGQYMNLQSPSKRIYVQTKKLESDNFSSQAFTCCHPRKCNYSVFPFIQNNNNKSAWNYLLATFSTFVIQVGQKAFLHALPIVDSNLVDGGSSANTTELSWRRGLDKTTGLNSQTNYLQSV